MYFYVFEDPGFFSVTVHQPKDSDGFEVSMGVADMGSGHVIKFSCLALTLFATVKVVTSEYHSFHCPLDATQGNGLTGQPIV